MPGRRRLARSTDRAASIRHEAARLHARLMDRLEEIARSSRRIVLTADLAAAGIGPDQVRRLHRQGRLVRLIQGAYAVAPLDAPIDRLVLRALTRRYAGSVVCCESALVVHGCSIPNPDRPHLLLPADHEPVSSVGFRTHCTRWPIPVTVVDGLSVVHPAVAVIGAWTDLRSREDRRAVVCAAVTSRIATAAQNGAQEPGRRRVRGAADLLETAALVELGCESPPEIDYLLAVERRCGLPPAERQVWIELPDGRRRRVDALYRAAKVIVEVDGAQHWLDEATRAADRLNDLALRAMGFVVLRFTWDDIRNRPGWVAASVRAALAAAA